MNSYLVVEHFVRSSNSNSLPQSWSAYPALAECSPASRGAVRPKMKTIPLTQGKFALVDDEDFDRLNQFKWYADFDGWNWYARRTVKRRGLFMHHLILRRPHQGLFIDHFDGDGLNNTKRNLRLSTHSQNQWNQKIVRSSSGFKGVYRHSPNRWRCMIQYKNLPINGGSFKNKKAAASAYDILAMKFFGRFAKTNKMLGLLK